MGFKVPTLKMSMNNIKWHLRLQVRTHSFPLEQYRFMPEVGYWMMMMMMMEKVTQLSKSEITQPIYTKAKIKHKNTEDLRLCTHRNRREQLTPSDQNLINRLLRNTVRGEKAVAENFRYI